MEKTCDAVLKSLNAKMATRKRLVLIAKDTGSPSTVRQAKPLEMESRSSRRLPGQGAESAAGDVPVDDRLYFRTKLRLSLIVP